MAGEAWRIVNKLWSHCSVLRDDGLSHGNHPEQVERIFVDLDPSR